MEGFLDIQLPAWKRILLTRSIAIVPSLCIAFMDPGSMTQFDSYLNILQCIIVPFAIFPLIKFVGSDKIMGEFALSRYH